MKIKRGWQLFAAVIEVAIMAAVAVFGAVMIAVPVPILLHFLSKYGVTGTPATMICRLAGVLLLIAGLWATRYCWRLLRASFLRVNDDRSLLHGEGALFSRDAAFAKLNRVSQIRGPAHYSQEICRKSYRA